MSYGVWRKRGEGWKSLEIDSPWNDSGSDAAFDRFDDRCGAEYGVDTITLSDGGHVLVIAAKDKASFRRAIKRHELVSPYVSENNELEIAEHLNGLPGVDPEFVENLKAGIKITGKAVPISAKWLRP